MNKFKRQIETLCKELIAFPNAYAQSWKTDAESILEHLHRPARRSPAAGMRGEKDRAEKDDTEIVRQQRETKQLREAAVQRYVLNGCVGELCGKPLYLEGAEMAHLEGGNGRKHEQQWIGNVVMEHPECHRIGPKSLDAAPKLWLTEVKAFCRRNGYRLPARWVAIEAKLEMSRKLKETQR